VLVLKKNGPWWMCVDYTDLNRAYPKDPFALPRIDQIIDSTAGCECLCFLDAYSGYHHIKMAEEDKRKQLSSRRLKLSAIHLCNLDLTVQVPLTSAVSSTVFTNRSVAMSTLMLMTMWSNLIRERPY
jgi:hypothetical protein